MAVSYNTKETKKKLVVIFSISFFLFSIFFFLNGNGGTSQRDGMDHLVRLWYRPSDTTQYNKEASLTLYTVGRRPFLLLLPCLWRGVKIWKIFSVENVDESWQVSVQPRDSLKKLKKLFFFFFFFFHYKKMKEKRVQSPPPFHYIILVFFFQIIQKDFFFSFCWIVSPARVLSKRDHWCTHKNRERERNSWIVHWSVRLWTNDRVASSYNNNKKTKTKKKRNFPLILCVVACRSCVDCERDVIKQKSAIVSSLVSCV